MQQREASIRQWPAATATKGGRCSARHRALQVVRCHTWRFGAAAAAAAAPQRGRFLRHRDMGKSSSFEIRMTAAQCTGDGSSSSSSRAGPSANLDDGDDDEAAALLGAPVMPGLSAAVGGKRGGGSWQLMVGMCTAAILICYADRSNMSTAIIAMGEDFDWDAAEKGVVLGAFFWGYAATQVLGGRAADTLGGKPVLSAGVAVWSAMTFLTPQAAAGGTALLLASRVALGLGEGIAFPAIHTLIARHVPGQMQSTSVALVTAASYIGTAVAFGVAPYIIQVSSWQWVFYLFGASAVVWLPLWAAMPLPPAALRLPALKPSSSDASRQAAEAAATTTPSSGLGPDGGGSGSGNGGESFPLAGAGGSSSTVQKRGAGAAGGGELSASGRSEWADWDDDGAWADGGGGSGGGDGGGGSKSGVGFQGPLLAAVGGGGGGAPAVGFWPLMGRREVWAICVAQYTGSWGLYGLLTWLPSFFQDQYSVDITDLGSYTLTPYVVQGVLGAASGVIADGLLARGYGVRQVRRWLQVIGMLGPAACLVAAASPLPNGDAAVASALVTVGLGLSAMTLGAVSVSHLDVAPKHAGVIFAAGNTAATVAGLLAVPLTGVLLKATGSWLVVFGVTAAHYVVGAAVWAMWLGGEPLPEDG